MIDSGEVSARTFQANDGSSRVSLEVSADDVEFLSSRNEVAPAPMAPAAPAGVTAQNSGFTAVETEDLPF